MVEICLPERHLQWHLLWCGPAPWHSCVAELFVLGLSFHLLHFLCGQSSFKFGNLDTLLSGIFASCLAFSNITLQLHCHCRVSCRVCGLQHVFLLEETKLAVFCAEPASAELAFPSWIGFAVTGESGDIHLYGFCFFFLAVFGLNDWNSSNGWIFSTLLQKKKKRFYHFHPDTLETVICYQIAEVCNFWAPLGYLTVGGSPAVVVTGIASQVQPFPIPPCLWWFSPFQLSL